MKRILILAVLLAGCEPSPSVTRSSTEDLIVVTDHETGCMYLTTRGITSRIAADGKTHMGCKAVAP